MFRGTTVLIALSFMTLMFKGTTEFIAIINSVF